MKIAVVSDTHRHYGKIEKVCHIIAQENPDRILHLGDLAEDADVMEALLDRTVLRVAGNCDGGSGEPLELLLQLEGQTIFATHGHLYRVKLTTEGLLQAARDKGASIALYGHTHLAREESRLGVTLVNPGSAALPHGGQAPTMAFLELAPQGVKVRFVPIG